MEKPLVPLESASPSADGSTVAIGATNDGNGSSAGHVRICELNPPTQAQQGDILTPTSPISSMPMAPFNPPPTSSPAAITVIPGLI